MGDDAWLCHTAAQYEKPAYVCDTSWVKGKVTRKCTDEAGQYEVDIRSESQRNPIPITGQATVILASKIGGSQVPAVDTKQHPLHLGRRWFF